MVTVNENYLKLRGSYLFSEIGRRVNTFAAEHPDKKVIRLGIGDVTQPLAPAIIKALHEAVDEMGAAETFRGYAPDLGYEFLRKTISEQDYKARGCRIEADEIFVSDGAKSDSGNIQEIFGADISITGAEAAVMVSNALDLKASGEEREEVPAWAEYALRAVEEVGMALDADIPLTRGEAAELMYQVSGRITEPTRYYS